jgi:hypothetical protein
MESLQLYFSILCLLLLGVAFYFTWKRYRLLLALAFSVTLYVLPMSHLWHLIWGENLLFELCDADEDLLFAWTDCIAEDFYEVFLNSYEITIFLEVALLRGYAVYLGVQQRNATMNYKKRLAWLYFLVMNVICICLSVLLWVLPGSLLRSYVMPYNIVAVVLSVLIIYLFASIPVAKRRRKEEEEIPLNEFSIESLSDSEI